MCSAWCKRCYPGCNCGSQQGIERGQTSLDKRSNPPWRLSGATVLEAIRKQRLATPSIWEIVRADPLSRGGRSSVATSPADFSVVLFRPNFMLASEGYPMKVHKNQRLLTLPSPPHLPCGATNQGT